MTREHIEDLVKQAYAARVRGDLDGLMQYFGDNPHFTLAGSTAASPVPISVAGKAAVREALRRLMDGFEFGEAELVNIIVEGPDAAVHSRLRIRVPGAAEWSVTEVVDLLRFEGDKIVSIKQFADTALAARLASGG